MICNNIMPLQFVVGEETYPSGVSLFFLQGPISHCFTLRLQNGSCYIDFAKTVKIIISDPASLQRRRPLLSNACSERLSIARNSSILSNPNQEVTLSIKILLGFSRDFKQDQPVGTKCSLFLCHKHGL